MSTGAIIFAFNGDLEYTRIAQECARRIKHYLNIPVTLISDSVRTYSGFDNQLLVERASATGNRSWADCDVPIAWRNSGRSTAFELSPYDRTLLIDADYWIDSNNLSCLLESNASFLAHNNRMYVNETVPKTETFGMLKTPMWWATVCVFDRSEYSQDVFDAWHMIETNYDHYANLFQFNRKPFRNDYALSLALLLVNGGIMPTQSIPWPLINVPDSCDVDLTDHWTLGYTVYENQQLKPKRITVKDQDLHVMGKRNLEKLLELHG
jgi:hypothetical protein